jgi:hypothetical protein
VSGAERGGPAGADKLKTRTLLSPPRTGSYDQICNHGSEGTVVYDQKPAHANPWNTAKKPHCNGPQHWMYSSPLIDGH